MTRTDPEIQDMVGRQYTALADVLAGEPATIGGRASLCRRWTVAHVVAHLTMPARYDHPAFLRELAAVGGDFTVLSDRIAERDGAHPLPELLVDLRSDTVAGWVPPGGGAMGALSHVVIHGLDITSAVGLPRSATDDATRAVLDALVGGVAARFGVDAAGRAWRAVDLGWDAGNGPVVEASAADLVLALAGRPRPTVDLRKD